MNRRQSENSPFEGVIVDAVTPRRAEELSIDLGATLELIDFLANAGVQAIALLAALGEFVHFALDDRRHMLKFAAKRSLVPLLVNVTHSTVDGTVELAREAASSGVAGVILMPPYDLRYRQETVRAYFLACAAAIGDAAPILLCSVPEFMNEIEPSTAAGLLATGLFEGIIEASPSLEALRRIAEGTSGTPVTLLAGRDDLYCQAREFGARGVLSAAACAIPELMLALDRALKANQPARVTQLRAILGEFLEWLSEFPAPAAVKEAVRQRKLKAGVYGLPLGPEQDRKMNEFREWFSAWLPGVRRECQE